MTSAFSTSIPTLVSLLSWKDRAGRAGGLALGLEIREVLHSADVLSGVWSR